MDEILEYLESELKKLDDDEFDEAYMYFYKVYLTTYKEYIKRIGKKMGNSLRRRYDTVRYFVAGLTQ